jgi:hypothetical protein
MSPYVPIAEEFSRLYIENREDTFPGPDGIVREKYGIRESDVDLLPEEDRKALYFQFWSYCDKLLRPSAHWIPEEYANICFLLLRYVVSENHTEVQRIKAQSAGDQSYSMRLLDFLRPHAESINLAMSIAYPILLKRFKAKRPKSLG